MAFRIEQQTKVKHFDELTFELSYFLQLIRFDLIFDTVGPKHYSFELMSPLLNRGGTFVTIVTPLFPNVDKYGLVSGLARSAYKAARKTIYVSDKSIRKAN